jgi:hypothetical protein
MVDAVSTAVRTVHLVFAATWVGSVLFVTFGVLPLARDGEMDADPTRRILVRLTNVSRLCALVLLLTGGHMAATAYGLDGLTGTTAGYLVVAMVVLWLALAGLIEVAAARMTDELREKMVRSPTRDFLPWFYGASVIAVLLLLDAGVIAFVR